MILPHFEVCLASPTDAFVAQEAGAHRVELCAALLEGGLTPSYGSIALCRELLQIDMMCMIRPRGGDFYYHQQEVELMAKDVASCKEIGASGVVFGLLLPDGGLDLEPLKRLIDLAKPMQITFHRAFDVCRDPFEALEQLIELGVDRILTSGQAATAVEGSKLIGQLIQQADGRIGILPGGGITPQNVRQLVEQTAANEFHATAFKRLDSPMVHRNDKVYMGIPGLPEYEREITDAETVKAYLNALKVGG